MHTKHSVYVLGLLMLGGISVEAKPVSKALLVFAHPDDETMMGGTLGRLRENNIEVQALYVTEGEGGSIFLQKGDRVVETTPPSRGWMSRLCAKQTRRALGWFGIASARQLAEPDAAMRDGDAQPTRDVTQFLAANVWNVERVKQEIASFAQSFAPDIVFTLLPDNPHIHAHHQAVGILTRDLYRRGLLGRRVRQIYGVEERAWYPASAFAAKPDSGSETVGFDVGEYSEHLGQSYSQYAAQGASKHAGQPPGFRGEVTVNENFLLLGSKRANPLAQVLRSGYRLPRSRRPMAGWLHRQANIVKSRWPRNVRIESDAPRTTLRQRVSDLRYVRLALARKPITKR